MAPMKKTRQKSRKKSSSFRFFLLFFVIAVVTIVLLEYIDYKKGEKSFVFTRIIPLDKSRDQVEQFNTGCIKVLKANQVPYDYFQDKEDRYHFKIDIDENRYDGLMKKLQALTTRLKGQIALAEVQGLADKSIMLYKIRFNKTVTHLLLIAKHIERVKVVPVPEEKPEIKKTEETPPVKKPVPTVTSPRIAFIIDDIGAYDIGPLELKQLGVPVTASVLPDSRYAAESIHWLRQYNIETIIHMPMQPTNSNGNHYNPREVITIHSSDEQIRSLIQRTKKIVPIALGMNNHQGSLATSNKELMTRFMTILKDENLYFVDSRTIGNSMAYDTARKMNIKTTHKDLFLDHIQTYPHSVAQVRRLVDLALQKGKAVAIGHPFKTTLQAIKDSVEYIRSRGVKIVLVKELLD